MPLVLPLEQVDAKDGSLVGGKAAHLSALKRAALPVPGGFCVTATAFRQFLDSCPTWQDLLRMLSQISTTPCEQTGHLSNKALACLNQVPVPCAVEEAILAAWRAHGVERAYAVRSSATVEDEADYAFAGQFESSLNIRGRDALLAAVRKCWLSLFSERSLDYHAKNRLAIGQSAMAVVIQEMVPAAVAGVLFTIDPATGDATRIVIEAATGLGDKVVGGRVAPERIILAKSSLQILSRSAGETGSTNAKVLQDGVAEELARLSRRVEAVMPGPVDIEWALNDGVTYLLQARLVTGEHAARTWSERQVWTNGNAGEAVPEPITPMTHSMLMPFLQGLCDNLMGHLGFRVRAEALLTLIAGRPYFSMNLGAALLRRAPVIKPEDICQIFGGGHEPLVRKGLIHLASEDLPRLRFHPWQVIRRLPVVLVQIAQFLLLKDPRTVHTLHRPVGHSRVTSFEQLSDEALLETILATLPNEQTGRHPALRFMGIGAFSLMVFFALCKRWFGTDGAVVAARLTAGLGTLDPAEGGRDLWRLAELAHEHPGVGRVIEEELTFATLEPQLVGLAAGKAFLDRWHAFMARHGHHARGELELMNPRWCETPDVVLALVRNYLQAATRNLAVPATRLSELSEQRAALERACLDRLKPAPNRLLFRWSLECARRGVAIKENVKSDFVKHLCRARLLLLELGRRMADSGRCADRDDVFFLRAEELRAEFLFGKSGGLHEITAARRAEYEQNQRLHPPPVVFGSDNPNAWRADPSVPAVEYLEGLAVSSGVAVGRARVILKPDGEDRVLPGEILVAPSTDPAWSPYFLTAAGIAIDLGGVLSHGSILAREYGLPAVTNLGYATRAIRTGDWVRVDGNRGEVTVLERAPCG